MNAATTSETGVTSSTTKVMVTLTESIKPRVPKMVMSPVNSWVKPIKSPSANWSTSAITRLTISPVGCPSRYLRGSFCRCRKASLRMSRTTR